MILYHFSSIRRFLRERKMVCEIPREGLRAYAGVVITKGRKCVWLTADPVPGARHPPESSCLRIGVRIPNADRKLWRYVSWMEREHPSLTVSYLVQAMQRYGTPEDTQSLIQSW